MKKEYFNLLTVLDLLIAFHRELISVEQDKINLIIKQDWKELEQQVQKSREILNNIQSAEKTRLSIVEKIGGKPELKISELSKSMPEGMKEDILASSRRLCSLITELKNLNERSALLLSSSLEVVEFTLSLFAGASSKTRTYGGNGEEKRDEGRHTSLVLDMKA